MYMYAWVSEASRKCSDGKIYATVLIRRGPSGFRRVRDAWLTQRPEGHFIRQAYAATVQHHTFTLNRSRIPTSKPFEESGRGRKFAIYVSSLRGSNKTSFAKVASYRFWVLGRCGGLQAINWLLATPETGRKLEGILPAEALAMA